VLPGTQFGVTVHHLNHNLSLLLLLLLLLLVVCR
jgi:hypothetical protein